MAISTGAALLGGALLGGATTLYSSKKAADAQENAADSAAGSQYAALQMQRDMYRQSRDDLKPWRKKGEWALSELKQQLLAGPGNFKASPGYKFRLNEGIKSLDRSAAARGRLLSGAQDQALIDYGQAMGSNEYQNFLNQYYNALTPYQSLAGLGQTTAGQTAQVGQNTANSLANIYANMGNTAMTAGDARASGYVGTANSINNTLGQAAMLYGMFGNKTPTVNSANWSASAPQTVNYNSLWNG